LPKSPARIFVLMKKIMLFTLFCGVVAVTYSCNRNPLTGSKLTLANYEQVIPGMTKAQVDRIMGPPTTIETKDMLVFKKTTYRYEEGSKFALFTFKNDELDSKEGNLASR
jgi:SmpA/OmlA family protein